jgi:hypothetical protein
MNLKSTIPFLDDEELMELAQKIDQSPDDQYQGVSLSRLCPFMDEDDLGKIFLERLTLKRPVDFILPFLNDDIFSKAADKFAAGEDIDFPVKRALPFMDEDDIEKIAGKIIQEGGTYKEISIDSLLPFLDESLVDRELLRRAKAGLPFENLLPFADESVLSQAVDDYIAGKGDGLSMDAIYPYLDDDDIRKLFRYEMDKKAEQK